VAAIWPYIECFSNILVACELLFCIPMLELRVSRPKAVAMIAAYLVLFNSRNINNLLSAENAQGPNWIISANTIVIFLASVVLIHLVFSSSKRLALFYAAAGYATENLVFYVRNMTSYFPGFPLEGMGLQAFKLVGSLAIGYFIYMQLIRRYPRGHEPNVTNAFMLAFVVLTLVVTNVLNTWVRVDGIQGPPVAILAILCNVMLLMIEFDVFRHSSMEQERAIMEQLMVERERQQRISQENVDLINVKCHDLKHQIAALRDMPAGVERDRTIDELEQAVLIYDSAVRTGNESLDTVLTEKGLICEGRGIDFTCMADGSALSHVGSVDLYTLFGNALDNAIEATEQVSDPDNRLVSLRVERRGTFVRISVENTCAHMAELVDGLPATTKDDPSYHGFGLKSIRMIVERLGGNMTIEQREGSFALHILLPAG